MFLGNFTVFKYSGKYLFFFLEHCLSIFCKTCCNHLFLKGNYMHFGRSLTGIHCVLTMYFRFIAGVFFCFFFLSRIICIYLFDNINCSHLSNKVNCDCFKSTKKYSVYLRKPIPALIFQWCLLYLQ